MARKQHYSRAGRPGLPDPHFLSGQIFAVWLIITSLTLVIFWFTSKVTAEHPEEGRGDMRMEKIDLRSMPRWEKTTWLLMMIYLIIAFSIFWVLRIQPPSFSCLGSTVDGAWISLKKNYRK